MRVHLPNVVEISVRSRFDGPPFFHLVQQTMEFEFRFEILQTAIAEGLQRAVGNHRGKEIVIFDEVISRHARIIRANPLLLFVQDVDTEDSLLRFDGDIDGRKERQLEGVFTLDDRRMVWMRII